MLKKGKTINIIITIIIFEILTYIIKPVIYGNIKTITLTAIIVITGAGILFFKLKKIKIELKHVINLIIVMGILLRTMYVVYTPINQRQHDVYGINDEGHLGYIYTIYETGKLPETNNIQFYHPPLFHLISAAWLRINSLCNMPLDRSIEGIQVITAIISILIIVVSYKIIERIKLKDIYKLLIMTIMAFHPTLIILSGSINNDVLLVLLSLAIILYLIKWNEKTNIKNTIILALYTGLCVMTKISGAIMAIPILMVFISKIIETIKNNKPEFKNVLGKVILFGLISLPIGLWHPIRNYILFKQPIGGVLLPSDSLYVGNYSFIKRFILISFKELYGNVYCAIPGEYNVLSSIIKTSVLGEFSYDNISTIACILKSLNIIIILASIISTIYITIKTDKKDENCFIEKLLLITWIVNVISYYIFNIKYPYLCTMNFRYLVPTVFCGIVFISTCLDRYFKNETLKQIIEYSIILFSVVSFTMFFMI